jgi:hypothetical protein
MLKQSVTAMNLAHGATIMNVKLIPNSADEILGRSHLFRKMTVNNSTIHKPLRIRPLLVLLALLSLFTLPATAAAGASDGRTVIDVTARGDLMNTRDGQPSTKCALGFPTFMREVTHGAGQFIAVGGSYADRSSVILRSRCGRFFSEVSALNKSPLFGVTYGNGLFVAVGDKGQIIVSRNGRSWKTIPPLTDALLTAVAYGNGKFVAVGASGTVLSSIDGLAWAPEPSETKEFLSRVEFKNGFFLAQGNAGSQLVAAQQRSFTITQ